MIAFTSTAAYLNIPCLQIYDSNIALPAAQYRVTSLPRKIVGFFKRVIRFSSSLDNLLSLAYLMVTTAATSNYVDTHNKLLRELLKLKNPYAGSHQYREGASLIVPNHPTKETMINLGWQEESVFVLGQPRLDLIFRKEFNRDECLTQWQISKNRKLIVLATQPMVDIWTSTDRKAHLAAVIRATANFPEVGLLVHPHPDENKETYHRILGDLNTTDITILQNTDIHGLLHACEFFITTHSTTVLEAMILNKPVICIDFTGPILKTARHSVCLADNE